MITYDEFNTQLYRIFSQDPELNSIPLEEILDAIPTIDQMPDIPAGSTVIVRADLDVPLKDGAIEDSSRIETAGATLRYCLDHGWKVVLLAHIGRDRKNTLLPVCQAVEEVAGQKLEFLGDWLDETETRLVDAVVDRIAKAAPRTLLMLENARRYQIERALWTADVANFPAISKQMYTIATQLRDKISGTLIHEAIAASNFDFSSSVLPLAMSHVCFGFYISEELKTHIREARHADLIVISGLKIDKLDDLEGIIARRAAKIVIAAGSLAMALKKAEAEFAGTNFSIGRAETDPKAKFYVSRLRIDQAKRIVERCAKDNVDLVLPIDFVLDDGEIATAIPPDKAQFDIGPQTRRLISEKVSAYLERRRGSGQRSAMFYNGVFGKFEDPRFESGTRDFVSLLRLLTDAGVETYVGGGEGRLALLKFGSISDVTHAFTAGGTILKSLSDKHIQYLKAMYLQSCAHPRAGVRG